MRVSTIVTVTVLVTDEKLKLTGLPNRFAGCFTKIPTQAKLWEAVLHKADLQKVPERMVENVLKVVAILPAGQVDNGSNRLGSVTIFEEPLFLP